MIILLFKLILVLVIQILNYMDQKKKVVLANSDTTTDIKISIKNITLSITKDKKCLKIILTLA